MPDWFVGVPMTDSAKNAKPHQHRRVLQIPRKVYERRYEESWEALEADAFAKRDGIEPWLIWGSDIAPKGYAYVREGKAEDVLVGRALLYSQGW